MDHKEFMNILTNNTPSEESMEVIKKEFYELARKLNIRMTELDEDGSRFLSSPEWVVSLDYFLSHFKNDIFLSMMMTKDMPKDIY